MFICVNVVTGSVRTFGFSHWYKYTVCSLVFRSLNLHKMEKEEEVKKSLLDLKFYKHLWSPYALHYTLQKKRTLAGIWFWIPWEKARRRAPRFTKNYGSHYQVLCRHVMLSWSSPFSFSLSPVESGAFFLFSPYNTPMYWCVLSLKHANI